MCTACASIIGGAGVLHPPLHLKQLRVIASPRVWFPGASRVEARSPLAPSRIRQAGRGAVAARAEELLPKMASRGKEARGSPEAGRPNRPERGDRKERAGTGRVGVGLGRTVPTVPLIKVL